MVYTGGRKDWELEYEFLEKKSGSKTPCCFCIFLLKWYYFREHDTRHEAPSIKGR